MNISVCNALSGQLSRCRTTAHRLPISCNTRVFSELIYYDDNNQNKLCLLFIHILSPCILKVIMMFQYNTNCILKKTTEKNV